MKNLCFFGGCFFNKKKLLAFGILNKSKYLGKGLSYFKNWGIGVNYCWNYGPSKLLLHSKHTKITLNSVIQYFEGCSQKKCLLKVWSFLVHPPCKIFAKLNGNHLLMANIFKLHEYQTFGLMKMHNMCKIWLANNIFSLWRWNKKFKKKFFFHDFSRAFSCQKFSQTWDYAFNYIGY